MFTYFNCVCNFYFFLCKEISQLITAVSSTLQIHSSCFSIFSSLMPNEYTTIIRLSTPKQIIFISFSFFFFILFLPPHYDNYVSPKLVLFFSILFLYLFIFILFFEPPGMKCSNLSTSIRVYFLHRFLI